MSKKLLSTLIASLFVAGPTFAQSADDPMRVQGTATLGGIYNNTSARDTAQLDLYQDLSNGALSNVGVQGRNSTTWFQGYGENFGRTDQYMFLRGGMYDVFKAGAYLNDIPHTFSSAAYTPYAGSGGNKLTATFPLSSVPAAGVYPPPGWNQFTLGYDRRDAGGFAEWQKNSPWYFRVDGNQVSFSGTKPGSAANGTSPGNGYVDLAIPTEYKTSNWGVEGGYQSGKATFAARWDYSKFDNANSQLLWTNSYFGANLLDSYALAPSNEFNKFTLTGNYRDLPWKSVVSARYTWAKTTSDSSLAPYALNTGPTYAPTLASEGSFKGENINQSFALAWTAQPAKQRRVPCLLLLDEAAEQLGPGRIRPRADHAARQRPGLRELHARQRHPDDDSRQLRQRALQLHEEQRRLRRVVEVRARQPARLRLGLRQPGPGPLRLRQVALEQAVGRVQEHDARLAGGAREVPVREA